MKHTLLTTLLALAGNVFVFGQDTIITLRPDNMPCVKLSLAASERMPQKRLYNRQNRPMPNGIPFSPRLQPAPMPGPKLELLLPRKRKWQ